MNHPHCPYCKHKLTRSDIGTLFAALRTNPGRQQTNAKRCPCGFTTFKRAKSRKFDCCRAAGVIEGGIREYNRAQ